MTYASTIGTKLGSEMNAELNRRLQEVVPPASASASEHPFFDLEVVNMAASIYGTSPEDAYLHAEILTTTYPADPFLIDVPLKGTNCGGIRYNKVLINKASQEQRKVISDFCNEMASWMTFMKDSDSLKASMLETINARLKKENPDQVVSLSDLEIFAVKDSGFFQFELTTSIEGHQMLIFIPAKGDEYLLPDFSTEPICKRDRYDLYELIDSHICGDLKLVLSYHAKASIISIFRELSELYFFRSSSGHKDSLAIMVDVD